MLPLQRVLLAGEMLVHLLVLAGPRAVRAHVLLPLRELLLVHLPQLLHGQVQVGDEGVAAAAGEVLAHDDAHHLERAGVRGHGVRRHDPAALAQVVRDGELVEGVLLVWVQAEGDEREARAVRFGHQDETHLLHGRAEVVGGARQVEHDGAVALLAQADHLVVLADDLAGATGEIEREGRLVRAEVVDVEDQFCACPSVLQTDKSHE